MPLAALQRLLAPCLLFLLAFAVLWKGGKSLETTWLLALFAGFAAYISWASSHGRPLTRWQRASWWTLIVFILWTVLAYAVSRTRNYGLDEVLRDGSFALLFFSIQREGATEAFLRRFAATVTGAAAIASVIGVAVYCLQPVNRFVGTFVDHRFHTDYWPNAWAQFLLLAWPLAVCALMAWTAKGRRADLLRGVLLGLLLGALLLSYSRGAFIAMSGQLLLLAMLSLPAWRKVAAHGKGVLTSALTALLVGLLVFSASNALRGRLYDVQSVAEKVTFTADEGTSSIDERAQFWQQAWTLAKERPWTGWGPYAFRFVQPTLQRHVLATSDHPHNVFLKLAMERGIPAMLLFVLFLLLVLLPALWALRTDGPHAWRRRLLLTAIVGVLAHNLIDFNLQFVGIALPWWLLLAFLSAEPAGTGRNTDRHIRLTTEVVLAAALLVVTVLEGRHLVLSSLGRHAQAAGDPVQAMAWYDASRNQLFSRDLHLSRAQLAMDSGDDAAARQAVSAYMAQNAEDSRVWSLDAEWARETGDTARELSSAREAFRRGAYDYVAMVRGFLTALQDAQQPLEPYNAELDALFKAYEQALMGNVHFIALSQNADDFAAWAREMAAAYPADAGRYRSVAAAVAAHVQEERNRFSARTPGMLW